MTTRRQAHPSRRRRVRLAERAFLVVVGLGLIFIALQSVIAGLRGHDYFFFGTGTVLLLIAGAMFSLAFRESRR